MTKLRFKKKLLATPLLFLCLTSLWPFQLNYDKKSPTPISIHENKVLANSIYAPIGGNLVVGITGGTDSTNTGSWKGTLSSDNFYWNIVRTATATSLDANLEFTGVNLYGANKLIVTTEEGNVSSAVAFYHQICDWTSTTGVDDAADAQCTGGGWRTLNPRKATYTNTAETSRDYELYNGYFWNTTSAPGTVISTPLSNFIKTSTNTVKIRYISKTSSTVAINIDRVQIETAIDPYYETAAFNKTTGGTITGNITDLIGTGSSTNLTASDGNKMTVPMSAINTAVDIDFTFKNVKTYTGANTILITPEICVSNVALTFGIYLYNYNTAGYTQIGSNTTGTACATDTDYAYSFNSTSVGGFSIDDYVSSGDVKLRILTNSPGTVYNIQIDRVYMLVGSVNDDSAKCEISWGTGTATNCSNTRSINQAKTGTPTGSTWQATAALEYPSSFYAQDNDDDAVDAEYAASQNLSFPVTLSSNMSVTAIHYAAKYRSNSTTQTMDLQVRDYSGNSGTITGWANTPGTDTNALTTYGWFDTWGLAEFQISPKDTIDTVNNLMNLRARTSAGTTTNPGTRDWAFAIMSIRWTEETNRRTMLMRFPPTGGQLVTGSEVATGQTNMGSWKGLLGNDSGTNGSGNYWTTARSNGGTPGLNKQIQFDGVQIYSSNTMIVNVEDANITTGDAYIHQICDWISTTGVDNAADAQCTGGGWRTLNDTKTAYTLTADTTKYYDVYNGYFSDRTSSPGTVYSTPLTNFIKATTNTVLIRVYSTVSSTVQHRMDLAQIEMAIDPIYDASSVTAISPHTLATSGFISDIRGTGASDGSKMVFTNNATNPLNAYFSFKNVRTYTGANTIVVKPEICVSTTALTFTLYLYNFTTTTWDSLGSAITGTACATDTTYSYAMNNITMTDYVNTGEIRVRIGTAVANTNTLQVDRLYVMIGSTNTTAASSDCEISWGGGTLANCANTRNVASAETGTAAGSTWQISNQFEWPDEYYGFDEPSGSSGANAAYAANISFPITISSGMTISRIHYAYRFRSNSTAMTVAMSLKDYGGKSNATGGWTQVATTNALTTYSWVDSRQAVPLTTTPESYVDTSNNKMNMRMRTNTTTSTAQNVTMDWDFAMMSIRWNEPTPGTLSADIVDSGGVTVGSPSISFNSITTSFTCQTATATFGASSEKIRITNTSSNPAWSLSLAATSGVTALWQNVATDNYDYNDSGGSGCTDNGDADAFPGQMSLSFGSAVITASAGCNNTGLSFGSSTSYVQGTTDSAVLVTASASAMTGCYWDITGISVSQKVPSDQKSGTYTLNMSLSVVSN